ncbi:MAG: A/G-specific adenine glycosylase [Nitratireductor sp.]|nr:A/G-specific adenine glycosylase [Nitratireductor sp.]MCC0020577.1 A/G-specific adenine glycosylase [Nitratireductor sp.]
MPSFASDLLNWYDRHARRMPWRVMPRDRQAGAQADPYHVWLSEVMLQQTQVATVRDYFLDFASKWPAVEDLANAPSEDVMKAWAGLGYYSRARNLKKCAEKVAFELDGKFPSSASGLQQLPGIGPYTAAAIAAIAFDEPVAVVDGNIERVISRCFRIETELPAAKPEIRDRTQALLEHRRPGDFAQAMMDLGATICTPKRPACALCPVSAHCEALKAGDQETFPRKAAKSDKPVRKGAGFVITNESGAVFLRKRKENGLLGGMTEVPGTNWTSRIDGETGTEALPFAAGWQKCPPVRHTFTHFHLDVEVWRCEAKAVDMEGWWSSPGELPGEALPTLMKKIISSAIPDAFK